MSKNTKILIVALCVLALVAGMACAWYFGYYAPRQEELNAKDDSEITITIQVTHSDGTVKEFEVKTCATYLGEALMETDFVEAHEDTYGLYLDAMDGEAAAMADNKAWCFDKNGAMCETGVSQTIIADGDVYAFYILTW